MKKFAISIASASVLAVAALGLAGTATAAGGADVTVDGLKTEGYSVQLNKTPSANLSQCAVTNVNRIRYQALTPPPMSISPAQTGASLDFRAAWPGAMSSGLV